MRGGISRRETRHGRVSSHASSPEVSILFHRVLAECMPLVNIVFLGKGNCTWAVVHLPL